MEHLLPVIWVIVAIALLLFLTVKAKMHSMIALLLIAIFVAFMEGMDTTTLVKTVTKGAGSTFRRCWLNYRFRGSIRAINDRLRCF